MTRLARSTVAAFVTIVLIGGTNYVAVKFSNTELAPLFGAGVRFGLAALIFTGIMLARRLPFPRGVALAGAAIYGLLSFGVVYGLIYYALLGIGAGTTSVIMASLPLVTLVVAVLHGQERFSLRGVAGGLLALTGIGVLSLRTLGGELALLPIAAVVGAVFAAAEGTVLVKGFPRSHPVITNVVGMASGSIALLLASGLIGEPWSIPSSPATWLALAWLVILGSVTMFGLFVLVVKRWKASATVYALTLMPLVAVSLGALLAGETVTIEIFAGGALVILGVYVGALAGAGRRAAEPALSQSAGTVAGRG